jgi:hypothetical protein
MLINRLENYKKLEDLRKSRLLVYVTGDRQGAETNIGADILPSFANHLNKPLHLFQRRQHPRWMEFGKLDKEFL